MDSDTVMLVDDLLQCSPEMEEMICRAQSNPLALILGTFHSYKLN